jgi:glutathione S-transferase
MSTSTPKLVLYDFNNDTGIDGWESFSPYVLEVARALKLAKLPYEQRGVGMRQISALNPLGQLPVLAVGGENVADSTAILRRIEELRPGSLTAGLDARALAEAWLWEEFSDTALYPHVLITRWVDDRGWHVPRDLFFNSMPKPFGALVGAMVRRGIKKRLVERDFLKGGLARAYERIYSVLDDLDARAPAEGFWVGPRPTIADIGLFGQLHSMRLPMIKFQAEEIKKRARLSAYLDRVDAATRGG